MPWRHIVLPSRQDTIAMETDGGHNVGDENDDDDDGAILQHPVNHNT